MPALKTITQAHLTRSLVRPNERSAGRYFTMRIASAADGLSAWGTTARDKQLRDFMRSEDLVSSATYNMASKYASFPYTLEGGSRTVEEVRNMLALSEHGKGWNILWQKVMTDAFSQDNGGWIELYREKDSPESPPVQLNHLDSQRIHRTGKWEQPVDYVDSVGTVHHLKWYDVLEVNDNPQPDEQAYGLGFCALSRFLRSAQTTKDIAVFNHEKVSGQFNRRVTVVNGVGPHALDDVLEENRLAARNRGYTRYVNGAVLSSIDPRAPLSKIDIDLAALPEGWQEDPYFRWLFVRLALAFGVDPMEFAPLPGNNIGSSQQSEILHLKGLSKGPAQFTSYIEHAFNFLGIVPQNVVFKFGKSDTMIDVDVQKARLMRAQELAIYVKAGILPPMMVALILAKEGNIPDEFLDLLDTSTSTTVVPNAQLGDVGHVPDVNKLTVPSSVAGNKLGGGASDSTTEPANATARSQ